MNNDLISRSALIEEFRKCYVSFDNTEMERSDFLVSFKSICRIINKPPTAYDKESVVEQLKVESFNAYVFGMYEYIRLDKAIEIVEKGGAE